MQRSKVEITLHFVWTTRHREPFLRHQAIEQAIFHCIAQECHKIGCELLAINGTPNHIHLLVKIPSTLAPARLAQAFKGTSAQMANSKLGFEGAFKWQENYAVFSVSDSHCPAVIRYIENQKHHHRVGDLWPEVEETFIEIEGK